MTPFMRRLDALLDEPTLVLSPRFTLADTTVNVLAALGISAHASTYLQTDEYGVEEQFAVVVTVEGDDVGWGTISPGQESQWTLGQPHGIRYVNVRQCVGAAALNMVATRVVLDIEGASASTRAIQRIVVRAWWKARLSEGHTPETARLMLSLIVPPDLLRTLTFPTDGAPILGAPAPMQPQPVGT